MQTVSWVHGNKDHARAVKRQFSAFKHKALKPLCLGTQNAKDLLGDDREHLKLNAVELVEAGPGTGLSHTLEELPHCFVIETIRAL